MHQDKSIILIEFKLKNVFDKYKNIYKYLTNKNIFLVKFVKKK